WLANMLERMPAQRPANPHQAMEELHVALEEAGIKPVPDPGLDGASALTVSPDPAFGRWARFYEIFGRMVETGFPKGAPDATTNGLSMIGGRVQDLESIAKKADYEHHGLADVLGRAREGRGRIAEQMDELNESAKAIRKELAPLRIAAERHGAKTETYPDKALELHRDIVRWEGRFGFTEPYKELADAYRAMADHVEKWWSVRSAQLSCESDAEAKEEQLREIDVQLEELREALRIHESNLSDELRTIEQSLSELGGQADRIELELLDTASRFCAPLRSKPQLGPLFRELAQA
ncbi:MAG: hypothetical protein KC731_37465, partial [Myxococcales bacterium]|nr:hypothetical protein [Myxococcales bacterium]